MLAAAGDPAQVPDHKSIMRASINPFENESARRLVVIGHPAHELAIYGLLQRYRPQIVVLTDGGGPERVAQSKEGLERIGLLDQATYLDYTEDSFYQALLDDDAGLFERVAAELRTRIERIQPDQVFCDAVEFYNPVHDVTRPILIRALKGLEGISSFEIPLVYQKPAESECYEIQRVPEALANRRIRYELDDRELDAKMHARDHVYLNLREQAGPEFLVVTREHLSREEIAEAGDELPGADSTGRVLRYEWRARKLLEEGSISRAITYHDHFLPMVRQLLS